MRPDELLDFDTYRNMNSFAIDSGNIEENSSDSLILVPINSFNQDII